ncbi:unnamed protein product [Acanthoscelides obtectus]|uniref:RCC1-like G exchanging factor-like protein n=1 Tax=Acanthoscelides obtectus TaxID=200917 RepID=A0A9P0KZQ0_ACAOB|nr:unnamed protein product [Acanthoscelides obtectus]CAK1620505.1 RCC1-like G exchanging factor-like protein [Acanthoscelides obtectus]
MSKTLKHLASRANFSLVGKRYLHGPKRKYPVNKEEAKELPVFQYTVSKPNYRRVFAWGNLHTGGLGLPYYKNDQNLEFTQFIKFPRRVTFGEKHEVTSAACGFGFTLFAVNSEDENKVYGCGINTDSQIGYHEVRQGHPLEILYDPRAINLPFQNPTKSKVLKISAGRAHSVILTDEGIFTLGNNAYGQCGRKIIPDENYAISNYIHHIQDIEGERIVDVECGQDHSLILTEKGKVYSCGWGADGQTGLGHYDNTTEFTRVKGDIDSENIVKFASRSDFVLAVNDKGQVFGWGNTEYGQLTLPDGSQQVAVPTHVRMLEQVGKIKSVASGGSFCLAVNDAGQVFSWGYGLLGVGPNAQQSREPIHIPDTLFGRNDFQPNSRVEEVVCGLFNAAAVTNLGDLFVWGRNKNFCLGLGDDKDQYFPLKVALGGFVNKMYSGVDHSIAVCEPFV